MNLEDKSERAREAFYQSPSKQFLKYMEDNRVMDIFQPALSLLYEMPVKPDNLYEFFAEFLENGAVDLLKISHLQAELCYKRAELQELYRESQEALVHRSFLQHGIEEKKMDSLVHIPRSSGSFNPMSISKTLAMKSIMQLDMKSGIGPIDFLSMKEHDSIGPRIRPKGQQDKGSGNTKVFKLGKPKKESDDWRDPLRSSGSKASIETLTPEMSIATVSVPIKEEEVKELLPIPTKETSGEPGRKIESTEKAKGKRKNKDVAEIPKEGYGVSQKPKGFGKKLSSTPQDGKGDRGTPKAGGLAPAKDEETMTDLSFLQLQEKKSPSKPSVHNRRIFKLVSGIEDPEERLAMENVLIMISDHKKLDPSGILFDLNRHTAEREYELELFARGASEELLRRLTARKSSIGAQPPLSGSEFLPPLQVNADTNQRTTSILPETDGGDEGQVGTLFIAEDDPGKRRLTEEEVKEILTEQNHRRLVRDGLNFLRDIRKERMKRQRSKKSIGEGADSSSHKYPASESEEGSSEDDTAERSGQLLRMLRETFMDSIENKARPCPVQTLYCPFESQFQPEPLEQPSIVVTTDGDSLPNDIPVISKPTPPSDLTHVSKKRIRGMVRELYLDYRKHLELLSSYFHQEEQSIYMGPYYEDELDKQFQRSMLPRRDVALTAITSRLHTVLQKQRRTRLRAFLRKHGNCASIGYKKLDPFPETARNEELRLHYGNGVPPISEKEYQRFLQRFDSKGHFDPVGLRTKIGFVYDFDLKEVKATQRWIDKTFPESVWRLNEPLGDPVEERDFEDDDDDNYVWLEDYDDGQQGDGAVQEQNGPISQIDLEMIQNFVQASQFCSEVKAAVGKEMPDDLHEKEVKVLEESALPQGTRLVYSPSLTSLLYTRPLRKPYVAMKRSERARRYVKTAFNPLTKANILNTFPFEMFDED